jgi:hypothetical protein
LLNVSRLFHGFVRHQDLIAVTACTTETGEALVWSALIVSQF